MDALLARLGLDGAAVFELRPPPAGASGAAAAGPAAPQPRPVVRSATSSLMDSAFAPPADEDGRGPGGGGGARPPLAPHIPWPCSLRRALGGAVDVAGPPGKPLLRLLAEHCADAEEAK